MLSVFDGLRSVTTLSVFVRLACAFICGGIIGIERSYKRRPAGFRTHILICIGAAITTLTSQYLYLNMHYFTDMARLGAQVVASANVYIWNNISKYIVNHNNSNSYEQ